MDDRIRRTRIIRTFVVFEAVVRCQGIEHLATVCQVGLESEDPGTGVGKVGEVDVEDLIALLEEVRNDMSSRFA